MRKMAIISFVVNEFEMKKKWLLYHKDKNNDIAERFFVKETVSKSV